MSRSERKKKTQRGLLSLHVCIEGDRLDHCIPGPVCLGGDRLDHCVPGPLVEKEGGL